MQARWVRLFPRHSSSAAYEVGKLGREAREFAESVAERLASNQQACSSIATQLDQKTRLRMMQALAAAEGRDGQKEISKSNLDDLFKEHDTLPPYNQLDRSEFEAAVNADRVIAAGQAAVTTGQSSVSNFSIALASSIPFIGMGAVDNAIMLVAGSEIDTLFGAKLGLSTLAAAGLGNMVSDVAGVSMANRIENMTRKMTWLNERAYQAGSKSKSSQAARLTGSVVGVAVGCLIGMAPLIFMDTHDHSDHSAAA